MKADSKEVTITLNGTRKTVGTASYSVYEAISEAVDDLGEEKCLELLNAQVRTNEMNRVRGLNRPGAPTKTMLRNKALATLTAADFATVAGDLAKIEALIESRMETIKEEMTTAAGTADPADDGTTNN